MSRPVSQDFTPTPAPKWAPDERLGFIVLLLGGAAFLFLLAKPLGHGSVYAPGDMGFFHLPLRQFYADCLAHGDNFHWIPWLFCGYYVHGEGQVGMYHPLHLLLYGLLPLNWAFNLEFLLNFVFLACGGYLWLRGWLPRRDGALLGSLLFTFCGFNVGHSFHINALSIIAHLPWMLLAIDWLIDDTRPWRRAAAGLGLGLLTMSEWLLGYPQYVLMNTLAEGIYLLWRLSLPPLGKNQESNSKNQFPPSSVWNLVLGSWGFPAGGWWVRIRVGAEVAIANILGLLAGCVQFLPTWETLQLSDRSAPSRLFLGMFSLQPVNLVQLFFSHSLSVDCFGGPEVVNGLFLTAGLLSLWPLRHWGKAGKLAGFALPVAGFSLFLAFGRFNPLFALYLKLPGVSVFRCPHRFTFLVDFAAAIGAAVLWCRLAQRPQETCRTWKGLAWFLLLPVLAWPALAALRPVLASVRQSTVWMEGYPLLCQVEPGGIARGVLWTAVLAALLILALRAWRLALVGLLLFILADHYSLVRWITKTPASSLAEVCASAVPPVMGNASRLDASDEVRANLLSFHGVRLTTGYVGLYPRRYLDYATTVADRLAGVAWKWHEGRWQRVDGLPRARLISRTLVSAVPNQAISQIDVATTACLLAPLHLDGGPPGTATIVSDRPGQVSISVAAPSRRLLVLAESFHPGWRVTVDGKRQQPLAVYGDFLGCQVAPGRHEVEFSFAPRSLRWGARLSVLGLSLLLVWFVGTGWLSRRKVAWMPDTSTN